LNAFLVILFRWLHIVPAAIAIGGLFVMRFVLPVGLAQIDPEQAKTVFLKCRRVFKISIHASILFLLISGAYNAWSNWGKYHEGIPVSHAFFGLHLLLGLTAIVISLIILAPKDPPASHRSWAAVNFVILLAAVAAAGCLKWKRDHTPAAATPATARP
jgi:uncharacterized membrane protein